MPVSLQIVGAEELRRTAAKLKQVENGKQVRREMTRELRAVGNDAVDAAQDAVQALGSSASRGGGGQARRAHRLARRARPSDRLKQRAFEGRGLRATTAGAVHTVVRTGGRSAGVRIEVNKAKLPRDQRELPGHMDTGKWRHPVFDRKLSVPGRGYGRGKVWVTQTVTRAGWFSVTVPPYGPVAARRSYDVIDGINRRVIA